MENVQKVPRESAAPPLNLPVYLPCLCSSGLNYKARLPDLGHAVCKEPREHTQDPASVVHSLS